jgi:transcriptional regulator GlxA family with amidase domain
MSHLQAVRARRAISLLHNSTLTLEAIASMCGYDSASHLSRMVKRSTGKSPGTLRRQSS